MIDTVYRINPYLRIPHTYYFDYTNGNDNNSGAYQNPKKTITAANALNLLPGDRVLFLRGQTFTDARLRPVLSGRPGRPIIFADYGSGALPIISNASGGFYENGLQYLTLKNIDFRNGSITVSLSGGSVGSSFIQCIGLNISGHTGVGYYTDGSVTPITDCLVDSCTIIGNNGAQHGILTDTSKVIIQYNTITNNGNTAFLHNIYIGHNSFDCIIRGNYLAGSSGHGACTRVNAQGHIFEGNFSTGNGCNGINVQDTITNSGIMVRNNICTLNGISNLFLGATGTGISAYHNTLINGTQFGIKMDDTTVLGNTLKNNLVVQDGAVVGAGNPCIRGPSAAVSGNTYDNNDYYYVGYTTPCNIGGTPQTLAQWQAATGNPDSHSISADPLFVTNYTNFNLQSISPCRAAGADLRSQVPTDYAQNVRDASPDIGAYEYV